MDIINTSLLEIHEGYVQGRWTAREIVSAYLEQIRKEEGQINAFITLMDEEALRMAEVLDAKREAGEKLGALAGTVLSIKDNIAVKGVRMTCASKMLDTFIAPYDAEIITKLRAEDAIFIGKVNMDEFAMGGSTKTSYYGVTRNPLDRNRVSGGSSGGSAASVAAHFCTASIGSDTGGSVRQPGAFCGVVGMKPSFGSISRFGVTSMANTFDQIGVLTQNVADAQYLLSVLEGFDAKDATSTGNISLKEPLRTISFSEIRVAVPELISEFELDSNIKKGYEEVLDKIRSAGGTVSQVPIPYLDKAVAMYHVIVNGEVAPNMSRYDGVRFGHRSEQAATMDELYARSRGEGFGEEVKRRIMIGTHIMSMDHAQDYYYKALEMRRKLKEEFEKVFSRYDFILTPTAPHFAFLVEERQSPMMIYTGDTFTVPANLVGTCGISLPYQTETLPMGLQVMGRQGQDREVMSFAQALEEQL